MKSPEKIEQLAKKLRFSPAASTNNRILERAEAALKNKGDKSMIFTFKPVIKFAAAAAIIVVVFLGISLFDKVTTPAWAIEQTIDVLRQFNCIEVSGTIQNEDGKEVSFEAWARADAQQAGSDHMRVETSDGNLEIVSDHKQYRYDPATNEVKITENYGRACDLWPGAEFFEKFKKMALDWKESYGKDPATGRDRVFVTCSHEMAPHARSYWFEFDVESKLLVSFKQWENMTREGKARVNVKSIKYLESLPDDLFKFNIPQGAKVVL